MDLKDISARNFSDIEKKIFFLAWLNEQIKVTESVIFPILVGGSAVQLYTGGNYASVDMDIVLDDISTVVDILEANSFTKIEKQYYSREYDLLVEFVSGPAPGKINRLKYGEQFVLVTSLEEIIIDRLSAAKWWNVPKDLEWVRVMISSNNIIKLDIEYLRKRAAEEDIEDFLEKAFELR